FAHILIVMIAIDMENGNGAGVTGLSELGCRDLAPLQPDAVCLARGERHIIKLIWYRDRKQGYEKAFEETLHWHNRSPLLERCLEVGGSIALRSSRGAPRIHYKHGTGLVTPRHRSHDICAPPSQDADLNNVPAGGIGEDRHHGGDLVCVRFSEDTQRLAQNRRNFDHRQRRLSLGQVLQKGMESCSLVHQHAMLADVSPNWKLTDDRERDLPLRDQSVQNHIGNRDWTEDALNSVARDRLAQSE